MTSIKAISFGEYLVTQHKMRLDKSNILFADFLNSVSRLRVIEYTQRNTMCVNLHKGAEVKYV